MIRRLARFRLHAFLEQSPLLSKEQRMIAKKYFVLVAFLESLNLRKAV